MSTANIIIHPDFSYLAPFFKDIQRYFTQSSDSIHKARNELKIIKYQNAELVVKAFKIPNQINSLVYAAIRDSKAKKSYDNALRLEELGVTTPQPVGYVEFKTATTFSQSYFVTLKSPYSFTIREPLLDPLWPDHDVIFEQFGTFTASLHQKGILHEDYSPGNILISKENGNYRFDLVDINRMKFQPVSTEAGYKNLSKLWANSKDLSIIGKSYAAALGLNEAECIRELIRFDAKHKAFKTFKKRIRGRK